MLLNFVSQRSPFHDDIIYISNWFIYNKKKPYVFQNFTSLSTLFSQTFLAFFINFFYIFFRYFLFQHFYTISQKIHRKSQNFFTEITQNFRKSCNTTVSQHFLLWEWSGSSSEYQKMRTYTEKKDVIREQAQFLEESRRNQG